MTSRVLLLILVVAVGCGGAPVPRSAPVHAAAPAPVVAVPAPAPVAPPPDDGQPLPLWSRVHTGKLPNGLTYYVIKNAKPAKRALMWLAVDAGSVQEDDDQRGVAHFAEHMAFNGTKRFPKNAIIAELEHMGMRFGADLNAETTFDHTIYKLEVPTDDPKFVTSGLDILRDWAGDVSYDPTEIGVAGKADKERGVVLEEWRLKRGARARLYDKQRQVLFAGTRYAVRAPIGEPDVIKNVSRDTLYRFYKDWYRPDLMAVVVIGDLKDPAAIEHEIQEHFADLAAPASPRAKQSGGFPSGQGTRISIEADPEAPATAIEIADLVPHRPDGSKRDYRRSLGEQLATQILRERFSTLSRQPDAAFTMATAVVSNVVRDADVFVRNAHAKQGRAEDTLRAVLTEVARIERHGVTPGELDRARADLTRTFDEGAERTTEARSLCAEVTRLYFEHEAMPGRVAEKQLVHEILPTITTDELDAAIKGFARGDSRAILISGPDPKALPARERVLAIVDEVAKADIAAWQDRPPPHTLMAQPPTPGKIMREQKLDKLGVTVWTLANGATVVVKPSDFEKDAVLIRASAPGGEAAAPDADYSSARFANEVGRVGGVGDLDAEALRDLFTGKQVRVTTAISETTQVIDASGSARDLEPMLQLMYLRMTAPREDADKITAWQQDFADQLTNAMRTPELAFSRDVVSTLWKGHRRRLLPDADDIAKIDVDKAFAFYKTRFANAGSFTFVIVGAVQLEALRPLVESYIGSLPSAGSAEKERDLGIRMVTGVVKKQWKRGHEPKAMVALQFHGDEAWTRDKDIDMFVLGQILSMRLRDVLREDLGGIYDVKASATLQRVPHPTRLVVIGFACDPARVDELIEATFGVIAELAKNGTSHFDKDGKPVDYLENVKQQFLRSHESDLRRNQAWLKQLSIAYRYGDDPAQFLETDPVIARMTSDRVQAAARRFLDHKQYLQAVLLPESN